MRVYVAGPYTIGDTAVNVRVAIMAGDQLIRSGHVPFVPHLSHFWHMLYPHKYETWIWYSAEWLKVCGAVVRLKGESVGADMEVHWAQQHGIPIFGSVDAFLQWHAEYYPVSTKPKDLTNFLDANSPGSRQPPSQDNDRRGSSGQK